MPDFPAGINVSALNGLDGFRVPGGSSGEGSGYSVSGAGDVNGDGFSDIIIGAPFADSSAGRGYVIFGKATSFGPSFGLGGLNGSNGFRLDGVYSGYQAGFSVSDAGDINGDGFDDLIIGVPLADGMTYAGGVSVVVFGKAASFGASINLPTLPGSAGQFFFGTEDTAFSGWSVSAAGDVNGDGFGDVIVGAPRQSPPPPNDSIDNGQAYVIYGSASGLLAGSTSGATGANGFTLTGSGSGPPFVSEELGRSVSSAGDVNGDGFDDVIIGAPFAGGTNAGYAQVILGGSGTSFTISSGAANGIVGYSVSGAGDVNGDGFDDFIIGAPSSNVNASGVAYVVFGSATGPAATSLSALDGTNGFAIAAGIASDRLGESVSGAGDVNGDGFDDIIVGAPGVGGITGAAYVIFGRESGFGASVNVTALDGSNGFALGSPESGTRLGRSVSGAGDVNGDGFGDIIIGDPAAATGTGSSYVVYGQEPKVAVLRIGSAADQNIFGGSMNDTLLGIGGDDVLRGGAGNDLLKGGEGADTIFGAAGDDSIEGNAGEDSIDGGDGIDLIRGDAGNDTIFGGDGDDVLGGYEGNDTLLGGDGNDGFLGGTGDDRLEGGNGNDSIFGEAGNDTIEGGAGNDLLIGDEGNDSIIGGLGSDIAWFKNANRADFAVSEISGGFQITDLRAGSPFGTDTVFEVEIFRFADGDVAAADLLGGLSIDGTSGNDLLNGGAGNDTIRGLAGNDTLNGFGGNDELLGDGGEDLIRGGTGNDTANGGSRNDIIFGDNGADSLLGGSGNDFLSGGSGNDTLIGGGDSDQLFGGASNDLLAGGLGDDRLDGGSGIDTADFSGAAMAVNVNLMTGSATGEGSDTPIGIENIIGSAFDDTLIGDTGANLLDGRGGADFFDGMSGNDTLIGGTRADEMFGGSFDDSIQGDAGNDRANGGSGNDIINGGGDNDLLIGGPGADTIIGGSGNDALTGGSGDDVFVFGAGSGADTITGFVAGAGNVDELDFSALGIAFGDLTIAQQGADTLITTPGGDSVLLLGVTATALDMNDDFVF